MPWLRRLVVGPSPEGAGFDPMPVHVRFVVDEMALRRVFLRVLRSCTVSTIPPMVRTCPQLHFDRTRRTNGQILVTAQKSTFLLEIGELWSEKEFHFSSTL